MMNIYGDSEFVTYPGRVVKTNRRADLIVNDLAVSVAEYQVL